LQDGCDNRCAYCIVPSVRGPARSARPERVLAEIRSLIDGGFREIVLTGINLGGYGHRIENHLRLSELLRQIVALPGLGRIRLSSIEPIFCDEEIVRIAAGSPVLAQHFHIPLQSGSDRILRAMRRPYTTARYRGLLELIRRELPDAGLGTDVIVGFPGETEQDFEETRRLLQELPLSYMHVFPFSPREGTEAFSLPDQVPPQVIKERMAQILDLGRAKNLEFRRRFLGRTLPAITLAKEEAEGGPVVLTHNYIHAHVPGLAAASNRLVDVRIEEVRADATSASIR
jgi:threonylcarbamoyladenosine tRNA methylthiotransferase MtaB